VLYDETESVVFVAVENDERHSAKQADKSSSNSVVQKQALHGFAALLHSNGSSFALQLNRGDRSLLSCSEDIAFSRTSKVDYL